MRLLVVGGGVAGPAVALAATRLGLDATVLERRPVADPDEGSWLTVAPNGLDALEVLGVLDDARTIGHPSRLNRMYGATGRHLGDISLGVPLDDGTVGLTMKRSALAVLLGDAARRTGADVRLGAEVVSVHDDDHGVRAVLADGSVVEGDLLVATDLRARDVGEPHDVTGRQRVRAVERPAPEHVVPRRRGEVVPEPGASGDAAEVGQPDVPRARRRRVDGPATPPPTTSSLMSGPSVRGSYISIIEG